MASKDLSAADVVRADGVPTRIGLGCDRGSCLPGTADISRRAPKNRAESKM
jgi:hypothetical protein